MNSQADLGIHLERGKLSTRVELSDHADYQLSNIYTNNQF